MPSNYIKYLKKAKKCTFFSLKSVQSTNLKKLKNHLEYRNGLEFNLRILNSSVEINLKFKSSQRIYNTFF
ncbi:hypothetical protein BpHYR1_027302 [Brachionus plicatilis]|uniref:Uncharacterized protein n=1 Tax=Brachionus plicatilis TaxID=10195 RepID=A0A3M7T7X9_BRAPC|nr:hypothetical protein BpHYR1_027302 [Brachionus plicatilis]